MAYHRYHGARHPHRPHLQHLRAAHAMRDGRVRAQLHHPGAERRAADGLRHGATDAELSLRRRSGRGDSANCLQGRSSPAGEYRQPARDDRAGVRQENYRADQVQERDRLTSRCRKTIRRCASPISPKRRTILGWEPKVILEEGLVKTIEYFRSQTEGAETMKIVVTGGAGFIASHIVDAYVERGHEVLSSTTSRPARAPTSTPKRRCTRSISPAMPKPLS